MSNISLIDGHIDNAEHCVCCGAVIPEGRQVCIICGLKTNYKQSTADVVEVRHGEWVKDRATIKCSCCGFGMYQDGYFFMDGKCFSTNNDKYTPNYCPHCGAKMDGKDGE